MVIPRQLLTTARLHSQPVFEVTFGALEAFLKGHMCGLKSARCMLVDLRKVLSKTGVNPKQPG